MDADISNAQPGDAPDPTAEFLVARPQLLRAAHQILGSWAEAEDVVQDAWLRWQRYDRDLVIDPTGFLVTTTRRLALNALQSARVRREVALVDRLSPAHAGSDPCQKVEHTEELRRALLHLVDRLTSAERAAFVLRHAFGYPYARIAALLDTTEVNARQIVSRARRRLGSEPHASRIRGDLEPLLGSFLAATQLGELHVLESRLVGDVASLRSEATPRRRQCRHAGSSLAA